MLHLKKLNTLKLGPVINFYTLPYMYKKYYKITIVEKNRTGVGFWL